MTRLSLVQRQRSKCIQWKGLVVSVQKETVFQPSFGINRAKGKKKYTQPYWERRLQRPRVRFNYSIIAQPHHAIPMAKNFMISSGTAEEESP